MFIRRGWHPHQGKTSIHALTLENITAYDLVPR